MFDSSVDSSIISCMQCEPTHFVQLARDAHVGILLEWLNAIACWQISAMILCSIWLVLPMFVLENEPRPRIVQWSYPASALKYINTRYRKFLFLRPLKWVSRTRVLHEWYVKSISEYAGARGTSASKLMLMCTTMCGTLQIVLAIGMNITQLCSRHRMWCLVLGGVCCVGIGVIESALLWESGDVKKQRKQESNQTRKKLAERAITGIVRRRSISQFNSNDSNTNSNNNSTQHSKQNSIDMSDDHKVNDNQLSNRNIKLHNMPKSTKRSSISDDHTASNSVYTLMKELSPDSQLRVIDRIAHTQRQHIHENNQECLSCSSDDDDDGSDRSEVDDYELLHAQSINPIKSRVTSQQLYDRANDDHNDSNSSPMLNQPPPFLYRASTETDTYVDESEKTRRVVYHTLSALCLIFSNWIAICFLDGGMYNRPEAAIFGTFGALVFFIFSIMQWFSGNYDSDIPHMLRTDQFLSVSLYNLFTCQQGRKQWHKDNILVRLHGGKQPTLGFVGKLFICVELISFFFIIACVPLEVIYHWNRYHVVGGDGSMSIPFIYDRNRQDNILAAAQL